MAEKGKPRRKRGIRMTFTLVIAPPNGVVILDPFMEALRAKAKELGYRSLDADVTDFEEVMGSDYHGWEAEHEVGVPW